MFKFYLVSILTDVALLEKVNYILSRNMQH